ncbi:MAG: preprotein translocase subunit SecA [Pseudomonadota bacterium]
MLSLVKKVFGTHNDRRIKEYKKRVKKINALEASFSELSDTQIKEKTVEFKGRFSNGETLDQLMIEMFALVREASKRVMGMRHFDVQLVGGMVLHEGKIAEMRTGEGKTLMATLAVCLNALAQQGVHVVTVNDYLAERDANWMRPLYEFLGLSVGVILSGQEGEHKKEAYAADITYGTNNEFGFDYLRDNMVFSMEERVQRTLFFSIVDEVDSILIDEARTPLIISGPAEDSSLMYQSINVLIPQLEKAVTEEINGKEVPISGHYIVDEKNRQVEFTEEGHEKIEQLLEKDGILEQGESLYASHKLILLHYVQIGLRAHVLFQKNVEYIVSEGQIVLIDEHTGRTMYGRRLSEGLHQAIEAKEGVSIQAESQTYASTTFQNYFRLYDKLSGMTGTADTEAVEFQQIYNLPVVVVPTNKPIQRKDLNDLIYMSQEEKYEAVIENIRELQAKQVPVLVGAATIESSETVSAFLTKSGVEHKVLNAKYHEKEAEIIAQAGQPGAITIATNMAGRGTDIVLGGNLEAELEALDNPSDAEIQERTAAWEKRHQHVLDNGGLHILGTDRHESRRIDNQLRGRAGRQGDPGSTRFFLSMDDNLMRIFAPEKMLNMMKGLGMERGEAIEHRMVSNAIERAQRKVEGHNFDIRKQLLEYDDVANEQRQIVYRQRTEIMSSYDLTPMITNMRKDVVFNSVLSFIPENSVEEMWDVPALETDLAAEFDVQADVQKWLDDDKKLTGPGVAQKVLDILTARYQAKTEEVGVEMRRFERFIVLEMFDNLWKEHLASMDHLRQSIHLRGYGGKDPKREYKRESFELFQGMLETLKLDATKFLLRVEIQQQESVDELEAERRAEQEKIEMQEQHAEVSSLASDEDDAVVEPGQPADVETFVRKEKKVGRNEPCPCGSGKKYKQCHGKV